jgi:hypothetical protein
MAKAGTVVLMSDAACRHVVNSGATERELATIARQVSDRIGFELSVYATLPTRDHPRAVEQARYWPASAA